MQDELQELLQKTEEGLRQLPKPPSNDAFAEILHVLSEFCRDLSKHLEGTPDEAGLLQAIQPMKDKFRGAIRDTAPDFRPYKSPTCNVLDPDSAWSPPSFLSNEEESCTVTVENPCAIYVDEVMKRAQKLVPDKLE